MPEMAESSPPAPVAGPGAAEPSDTAAKAAPADLNEFLKMAQDQEGYTVVKVYYGTDRAFINVQPKQPVYLPWLIRTIVAAATALFFSLLGFRLFPSRLIRVLAYCGMFATGVLAGLTIYARFQAPISDDLAKTSPAASVAYGPERGKLELGTCEVSIPKLHEVGELESPSVLRLEFREDPKRHVVLLGIQPEPADRFFADLRECVGRSSQKSALVFVHGYNVSFEDAARRTAQIAYDLKFEGAPIFFSWPSQAGILEYAVDETNVSWAAPHLLRFLTEVAEQSGAERIHLIAHSMGNRALTSALRDLSLMQKSDKPTFDEVVLTAPDIDADTFVNDIAPAVVKTARRVTLYSSSNDEALIVSKKVHGYPRAGDSGSQLVVLPGIDTVDVSAIDTSLLGHTYYGDNSTVLADIFELLNASKPADQRHWLRPERLGLLKYWVFHQ
jgi:esterase/lipase superfamily enzyme